MRQPQAPTQPHKLQGTQLIWTRKKEGQNNSMNKLCTTCYIIIRSIYHYFVEGGLLLSLGKSKLN